MSNDTPTPTGTVWIQAWSADGFKLGLTLPAATVGDALKHLDDARKAGLMASPPAPVAELAADEKADTITTVVRRKKKNKFDKVVPVIDCYFEGGKYRYITIYLDEPEQVAEFERVSGLKVENMPLYPGKDATQIDPKAPEDYEVRVPTPFIVIKKEDGGVAEMNGVEHKTYRFDRYGTPKVAPVVPLEAPAAPTPEPVDDLTSLATKEGATAFVNYWEGRGLKAADLLQALNIPRLSLFSGNRQAADTQVQKWLDAKGGGNALSSNPFQKAPKRRL